MTRDEIEAAAERWAATGGLPDSPQQDATNIARALLAALAIIAEARAHRDMADAVAEFDKVIEELRP